MLPLFIILSLVFLCTSLHFYAKHKKLLKENEKNHKFDVELLSDVYRKSQHKFSRNHDLLSSIKANDIIDKLDSSLISPPTNDAIIRDRILEPALKNYAGAVNEIIVDGILVTQFFVDKYVDAVKELEKEKALTRLHNAEIKAHRLKNRVVHWRDAEQNINALNEILCRLVSCSESELKDIENALTDISGRVKREEQLKEECIGLLDRIDSVQDYLKNIDWTNTQGTLNAVWHDFLDSGSRILRASKRDIQENVDKKYSLEALEIGDEIEGMLKQIETLNERSVLPLNVAVMTTSNGS